jgi:hypothetical protein
VETELDINKAGIESVDDEEIIKFTGIVKDPDEYFILPVLKFAVPVVLKSKFILPDELFALNPRDEFKFIIKPELLRFKL